MFALVLSYFNITVIFALVTLPTPRLRFQHWPYVCLGPVIFQYLHVCLGHPPHTTTQISTLALCLPWSSLIQHYCNVCLGHPHHTMTRISTLALCLPWSPSPHHDSDFNIGLMFALVQSYFNITVMFALVTLPTPRHRFQHWPYVCLGPVWFQHYCNVCLGHPPHTTTQISTLALCLPWSSLVSTLL